MMHALILSAILFSAAVCLAAAPTTQPFENFVIDYSTPIDPALQAKLEQIDAKVRGQFDIKPEQTNVGLLDLLHPRLAMIHPDHTVYAASVAKVGILLAYFQTHPEAATNLDPAVEHELGLMIRISSNEMASKYSHIVLKKIQEVLDNYGFYDKDHGGGIWVGKHYGKDSERYPDPLTGNSHAVNVRQLLRFYLMMEQGKLVSPTASAKMRKIFSLPTIPLDDFKFTKGLQGRGLNIIRKSGTWEQWLHDTAEITGPGRRYVLVALTENLKGDNYLEALAPLVDDLMQGK
jgi:beta-lactamase class A